MAPFIEIPLSGSPAAVNAGLLAAGGGPSPLRPAMPGLAGTLFNWVNARSQQLIAQISRTVQPVVEVQTFQRKFFRGRFSTGNTLASQVFIAPPVNQTYIIHYFGVNYSDGTLTTTWALNIVDPQDATVVVFPLFTGLSVAVGDITLFIGHEGAVDDTVELVFPMQARFVQTTDPGANASQSWPYLIEIKPSINEMDSSRSLPGGWTLGSAPS